MQKISSDMAVTKPAKDEAMTYLRNRDHTNAEVLKHLKRKGYDKKEVEECMEFLVDCHFIDDDRYCENFLHYAISKGKGPLRLRQELLNKGISEDLIHLHMEAFIDEELEFSQAMEQAEKLRNGVLLDEKRLAKIGRRLAYLGYHTRIIYRILDQLR